VLPQNRSLFLGFNSNGSFLSEYDLKGIKLKEKKLLNSRFKLVNACKTHNGELLYLFTGDDYLVVSFASPGF
jgi:hypothetical protein